MTEKKVEEEGTPTARAEAQRAAMLALGGDFQALLNMRGYHELPPFSKLVRINTHTLQHILDGKKTGPTVTLMTIYLIAGRLTADVDPQVPTDDWNNKTPLSDLWKMGAKIRLIAK